jgi:RimJ/RimL family protein N-acetyltransferase
MMPPVHIIYKGGVIRPCTEEDVDKRYVSGLNDPEVNKYLEVRHEKQDQQSVSEFVTENRLSSDSILFGIFPDAICGLVGTVRLHKISIRSRSCHIGLCIFEKSYWGKGIGSQSIALVTHWAFNSLRLRRVIAGVKNDNTASQRAFVKSGYNRIETDIKKPISYHQFVAEY